VALVGFRRTVLLAKILNGERFFQAVVPTQTACVSGVKARTAPTARIAARTANLRAC
jgi:hypothetical protein